MTAAAADKLNSQAIIGEDWPHRSFRNGNCLSGWMNQAEIARLRALPAVPTVRQSSRQLTDLVAAWGDATADERARLAAGILSEIQVKDRVIVAVRPRPAWAPYFEELLDDGSRERETRLELATSTLGRSRSTS